MLISPINHSKNNYYSPHFGINLQSKKLRFKNDDFFVKIKGYGTNSDWAKKIIETADAAANFIRTNLDFESILKYITSGVRQANQIPLDLDKRTHTGFLRIEKEGWLGPSGWRDYDLITRYNRHSRYKSYTDKLDNVVKHPLRNPYKNITLTRPIHDKDSGKFLEHANAQNINNAFLHVQNIYDRLHENFILKEAKEENLNEINSSIGEMRWILAHATPLERGSDAISNVFIRSVYKAMGIKTYSLKRGISLDLEAYCTELDDYKKNFSSYFQHKPYIAE